MVRLEGRWHTTPSIEWGEGVVPTDDIILTEWRRKSAELPDGSIRRTVIGLCPTCHGPSKQSQVSRGPLPEELEPPMTGVACECGYNHKHADAKGCGRSWAIPFNDIADEGT
jgi:hypothetical protein